MGEIYQAIRVGAGGFRKPVALKRLAAARALDGSALRRFFREARITARLEHPNIVRVYDLLEHRGEHFLVMELLQGHSLAAICGSSPTGEFSATLALAIAEQTLQGLTYAHALTDEEGKPVGLVHRDLVPGNLFICQDGRVKILDFGIAKLLAPIPTTFTLGGEATLQGVVHGTLEFLSPEQARGDEVDARSDVYQLGASLYYLVSGRAPHGEGLPSELVERAAHGRPLPLGELRPDLAPPLVALIERAMRPLPTERFEDAATMLAVVRALVTSEGDAGASQLARLCAGLAVSSTQEDRTTAVTRRVEGLRRRQNGAAAQAEETGPERTETVAPPEAPSTEPQRATPVPPSVPLGGRLGRYMLLEQLGEGGMGVVYAAYDPELDRKVALKLLRVRHSGSVTASQGQARLLREAQAMAKVSHPNVIAVFDVGTFEDRVFLAMELVDGMTLSRWLASGARAWREVIRVFIDAGRGLASAHAVGLVHRDFKPDNILIGSDGRVRVTDFGLARPATSGVTEEIVPSPPRSPPDTFSGLLSTPLTQAGAIVGTPGYMAPEQFRGATPDVRTDQFSFAVALYEALYRERPFDARALSAAINEGAPLAIREPPAKAGVPTWVWRIVRRGLLHQPEARFASLDEMLVALSHDPRATLRRRVGWAAVPLAVLAGLWSYHRAGSQASRMCRGADARLGGIWDRAVQKTVERSFAATGKGYAASTFERVARALDHYAADWAAMSTEACQATRVHGHQSDEVLSLRNVCLDRRLSDLKGLVELFSQADGAVVDRAIQAAYSLPPIKGCADVAALKMQVRLPEGREVRARIAAVGADLGRAKAFEAAGKFSQALPIDHQAIEAARKTGYKPLLAEAYLRAGVAEYMSGDLKGGEKSLYECIYAAESVGDARLAALAESVLITVVGYLEGHYDEARKLDRLTSAGLERLGGDDELDARRLNNIANVNYALSDYEGAARDYQDAHAKAVKALGPESPLALMTLNNYCDAILTLGHVQDGIQILQQVLQVEERVLGPQHPDLGFPLDTLANQLYLQGRYAEAQAIAERALKLRESALGPDHPYTGDSLQTLGTVLGERGDGARGIALLERALRVKEKAQGAEHPYVAEALEHLGQVLLHEHRYADALVRYQRALAIREKTQPENPGLSIPLTGIGEVHLAQAEPHEALAPLERAVRLIESKKEKVDPAIVADSHFALARALGALGREGPRARSLAERSREALTRLGHPPELARVESWLVAHPMR
jgi:serine/threonine protein kinase/tetratricopeptide (TPR) repeat protein